MNFDSQLARMVQGSRYAERRLAVSAALEHELREAGSQVFAPEEMLRSLAKPHSSEAALHGALRRLRERVMLRLIFRDLNGQADLHEVMTTISHLADVSLTAALAWHHRAVADEFGLDETARHHENAQLLIVGMGKLGAHELNVSSDIDLIFVHANDGEASATHSWHQFHIAVGKRVIRAIDDANEHGFVFRVDMRLRPFGASGPLVSSLAALEGYFQTQARPWERYAWLKARAISGHAATIKALDALVGPFVFRRYFDFAAMEEMRDLHGQIRAEAIKRNRITDIKVGEGGIREIEFVAQMHQLIRGGREARLRTRSTRDALAEIAALGLMPQERVTGLLESYTFLRNLEHRLQYVDDAQTQALPGSEADRARIAATMGFSDWSEFDAALTAHRKRVTREFESLFSSAPTAPVDQKSVNRAEDTVPNSSIGGHLQPLSELDTPSANAEDGRAMDERITTWTASARTQSLTPKLRARLAILIPEARAAALTTASPKTTFFRLFDILDAIDKRETYLALLMEYTAVIHRLANIAANSAWAADFVRRHPIVLDELIHPPRTDQLVDWQAERKKLDTQFAEHPADVERQYDLLRQTKQAILFRLNVADIEGRIGVMALSDELTMLADMLLDLTVHWAWRSLFSTDPFSGFAVIGYGKLGSKELGYASDLDIVFIYDGDANPSAVERWPRLAQRINSWLNTMTAGGVLYETDLRLRPDGASGLLVSSLAGYRDYQLNRAWTWEHQALTRARWCAGDPALMAGFDAIRAEVLTKVRDRQKLKTEIVDMRERMRGEKKDRANALDLKNTRGGIVDIEFIVQYLILAYAHEHREFLGNLGNFALLARAGALGILSEDEAAQLGKAYLAYRARLHAAQNNNERKAWIGLNELDAERAAVAKVWNSVFA